MAKKKKAAKKAEVVPEIDPAPIQQELTDLFVGGEEDDLMDMEYIQDETTTMKVETMPPETKEEAEARAEGEPEDDVEPEAEEEETKAEEEEDAVPPVEEEVVEEEPEARIEDPKIPKDRFDEINERMKKAEEKNKLLEDQLDTLVKTPDEPEPEPYDYAAQEKAAMDALLEGDQEKYATLRAEIRTAERADTLREAKKLAAQGDQQLQETLTFEEVGAKIEAEYPAFSETSDTYNKEAREDLLDLYLGYAQSGNYTRVQALQRAADKAAKLHTLSNETPEVPDNVVSLKQPDPKAKADVANKQPPMMEGKADREEEAPTDVQSMSDEEFSALPESAKRRLRGDIL